MKSYKLEEQRLIQEITALREKHIAWVNDVHRVLNEVQNERERQDEKFGTQDWEDGTGPHTGGWDEEAAHAKTLCDLATKNGNVTWLHIAREEVYEAFAETDPERLRAELVQCAAVFTAWVQAIDRRRAAQAKVEEALDATMGAGE